MSAWIVSKAHIDVLIGAALDEGYGGRFHWYTADGKAHELSRENANEVGAMLWAENHRSVNARYNESTPVPEYTFERRGTVSPGGVAKAVNCYEYQSCEHDGWRGSAAFEFCAALTGEMARKLPGYEDAPWGFEEENTPRQVGISLLDMMR